MAIVALAVAIPAGAQAVAAADAQRSWFEDVTHKAGILYRHHPRQFDNPYANIMQGYARLGSAVAVADYDGDGFEDIFVDRFLFHLQESSVPQSTGTFDHYGCWQAGDADGNDADNASTAALWFDFNNDGKPDLLVVRFGHSMLYENLGGGQFRDVTKSSGLGRYMNAIKAIAFDYDNDGYPDLFFGSYFSPQKYSTLTLRAFFLRALRPPTMVAV